MAGPAPYATITLTVQGRREFLVIVLACQATRYALVKFARAYIDGNGVRKNADLAVDYCKALTLAALKPNVYGNEKDPRQRGTWDKIVCVPVLTDCLFTSMTLNGQALSIVGVWPARSRSLVTHVWPSIRCEFCPAMPCSPAPHDNLFLLSRRLLLTPKPLARRACNERFK